MDKSLMDSIFDYVDEKMDKEIIGDTGKIGTADYAISSDEEADRILCMYQKNAETIKNNKIHADEVKKVYINLVDEWYEKNTGKLESYNEYLMSRINDYAASVNGGTSNKTTLKLLHGSVKYYRPKAKINYFDETAAVEWLKDNNLNTYIRSTECLEKNSLKDSCEVRDNKLYFDGKEVPGIRYDEQPMTLVLPDKQKYVKPVESDFWGVDDDEDIDIPF